jgi:multidrug resistance protein
MKQLSSDQTRPAKGAMAFIFGVVLLDVVGLSMLMPISAYIVRQYSADALSVTMLTVIYAAAQFLAAPLLGRLSDRFGRRPVLLVCVFGSAVGYFLFGVGGALWVLFLSRLIDGITGGNISVAGAYTADITPPEDRARSYALIGAGFGLGFVLGPAIGGALSQVSLAAPAYAAGVLSLINLGIGFFALAESLPAEKRDSGPLSLEDANPLSSIAGLARRPSLGLLLAVYALFQFAFNSRTSILSVFLIDKFSAPPAQLAALFVVSGIGNVVVQGFLVRLLVPRFGEKALVGASLAAQAVLAVLTYLVPAYWMQYPLNVVATGASGLLWPTLTALISNSVPQHEQGKVSGVSTALGSLMSVFGPLWAGALYDGVSHAAPLWTGAIFFVLGWLALARVRQPEAIGPQPEAVEA